MEKKERIRRFLVCVDGDGHFHVVNAANREKVIRVLKKIEDGDYFKNEIADSDKDEHQLYELNNKQWMEFLCNIQSRGRMEIVDLNKQV